jgi:hypothetical protein
MEILGDCWAWAAMDRAWATATHGIGDIFFILYFFHFFSDLNTID